jgi:hypothetical protein
MPARRQWSSLGFTVTHHTARDQIRIIKHRSEGVQQRVTKLAAFVNRTRHFRRDVAGNAAGK